jgi:hypothetical protein
MRDRIEDPFVPVAEDAAAERRQVALDARASSF